MIAETALERKKRMDRERYHHKRRDRTFVFKCRDSTRRHREKLREERKMRDKYRVENPYVRGKDNGNFKHGPRHIAVFRDDGDDGAVVRESWADRKRGWVPPPNVAQSDFIRPLTREQLMRRR